MMHAARFTGSRTTDVVTCALPAPGPFQVRVRLEGSGVCASNLPVWEGRPWFEYPLPPGAPGHEGWGVVDGAGSGVDPAWLGRRVAILSGNAYAEWDVADVAAVVPVPGALDGARCPGEPLACAVNVLERAGITSGETVVVVGVGFLGALLVALAAHAGARVVAVSRRPYAREMAGSLGAAETAPAGAAADRVAALTDGRMADCVIETGGLQETLDAAAPLVRVRGRLVIAGYHQDGVRQVNLQQWNWNGLDVINAHEREPAVYARGMAKALDLAAEGVLPLERLVTHAVTLDRLDEAFELMSSRPHGFLKAIVHCRA